MNKITGRQNLNQKLSFKKDVDVEIRDNLCNSCFRMELDGFTSTDSGIQWGFGTVDPTSQSSNMCNECFKMELDEPNFSLCGVSNVSCMQCGVCIEKNNDLFSAINGICNHCFLAVANPDHSCIRCDPTFSVNMETNYD
jgi:hypothetical protein